MRLAIAFFLTTTLFIFSGCAERRSASQSETSGSQKPADYDSAPPNASTRSAPEQQAKSGDATMKKVSLDQAESSQNAPTAIERKVIRNADMTLELASPTDGLRKITSIAEARGGFVVTSDATQRNGEDQLKPETVVKMVLRVPAAQFDATLNEIRGIGNNAPQVKITGQDVTEEYIDLEARIRTKKALEAQFLEIMKRANGVSEALEVQTQLATVRTEIEQLEGRRRYLESQTSLSTITVTLQPPATTISTTGFIGNLKSAFRDGVDIAASILLFLIRLILALLPIVLIIFLPLGFLARYFIRRARNARLARQLQTASE